MGTKIEASLKTAKKVMLSQIISNLYFKVPYVVIYIEGAAGIGKSQLVRQLRQDLSTITGKNWGLIDTRLSAYTAQDLQGLPYPKYESDGKEVQSFAYLKDKGLPGIGTHEEYGLFFLDEFNQISDSSVQSLTYQLILDGRINDYVFPKDKWFIICAGNREQDGGIYERIKAPVRDRMLIFDIKLDVLEWLEWASESGVHGSVIDFIEKKYNSNEDILHTYDARLEAEGDETCQNYIYATPRSWEFVSDRVNAYVKLLDSKGDLAKLLSSEDVLTTQICGLVGAKLGEEFMSFYRDKKNLPVAEILAAEWKNGKPTKAIKIKSLTGADAMRLVQIASSNNKSPNKQRDIWKIMIFAMYKKVSANTINIIKNNLTENGLREMITYLYKTDSSDVMTNYDLDYKAELVDMANQED